MGRQTHIVDSHKDKDQRCRRSLVVGFYTPRCVVVFSLLLGDFYFPHSEDNVIRTLSNVVIIIL